MVLFVLCRVKRILVMLANTLKLLLYLTEPHCYEETNIYNVLGSLISNADSNGS